MIPLIVLLTVLIIIFILLAVSFTMVRQSNAYIIERMGLYKKTLKKFSLIIPIFDRVRYKISLKEQVVDFPPQPVITKDNVTMQIDTVVFYQITDPRLYAYGVSNPLAAIENLTATTLRNIIGDLELDDSLTSRDVINVKMRSILDEATDPWGIKVNRVEVKNILPPRDIQEAMEKQMRAEREKREAILRAEGERESSIKRAEGEKRSQILRAEAEKASRILNAEAEKEEQIRKAEGEAEAILKVQTATAEGIRLINESNPGKALITLKSLEAFTKVADGKATKIIIPSEIQGLAGLASSFKEFLTDDNSNT